MSIFIGLSFMQLEFGILLVIIGSLVKKFSKQDKKKAFFNKTKKQGLFNIILGIISGIIQYLSEDLVLLSMIMFVVGVLFSIIYLVINLVIGIVKSDINNRNKVIIILGIVLLLIYMFFGEAIAYKLKIGFKKLDEPIKIGKEFLLYECTKKSHDTEKVYMTINEIKKDSYESEPKPELISTVMYFDLRYEGDKHINLVDEEHSFSDLCSFKTTVSSDKLKDDYWTDEFIIEDDVNIDILYGEYAKTLPKVIKPNTTLKNLTHPIAVTGVGYDNIAVEDIDIEIETEFKIQHEGKNIREDINKTKLNKD